MEWPMRSKGVPMNDPVVVFLQRLLLIVIACFIAVAGVIVGVIMFVGVRHLLEETKGQKGLRRALTVLGRSLQGMALGFWYVFLGLLILVLYVFVKGCIMAYKDGTLKEFLAPFTD
jgi:hypothetical protein